jgi:nucleotide-binding universal stress UspA family protein
MRERIVVGVDGSDAAECAVRWAAKEAAGRDTTVELVSAWHLPTSPGTFAVAMAADELIKELVRAAEVHLREAAATARSVDPGLRVETRTIEGQAATVLTEAARGADMLVVGSRGLGGFWGLLQGSVSQQCAHHAPCPLVIVPRNEPARAHGDTAGASEDRGWDHLARCEGGEG